MTKMIHSLRENSGKIGIALAVLTLAWSSISAYVSSSTHLEDIQAQQEKRLSDLESQVRTDLATRREIQDFKSETTARFDRIENMLARELEFHHQQHSAISTQHSAPEPYCCDQQDPKPLKRRGKKGAEEM